ncbi:MAG: hypothetical protein VKL00_07615 [Synechococcales bacterium]|nr:hypothetical protein [Synechococcales bacterium]
MERFRIWLSPDALLQPSDPIDHLLWRRNGFSIVARPPILLKIKPRSHLTVWAKVLDLGDRLWEQFSHS